VLLLAVSCYAYVMFRADRRAQALKLLASAAPPAALLIWYVAMARDTGHLVLYATLRDKLLSLAETVQFFPRLDPYHGSEALPCAQQTGGWPCRWLILCCQLVVACRCESGPGSRQGAR